MLCVMFEHVEKPIATDDSSLDPDQAIFSKVIYHNVFK